MADIKTVTDALRTEARLWDDQSDAMRMLRQAVEQQRITRVEAGIFQIAFSAYEAAIDEMTRRCQEGQDRMEEIATALIKNATAYDEGEVDTAQHIESAY